MKDTILFIAVIFGVFIVLPFAILWLRDKLFHRNPTPEEIKVATKRFRERLTAPDLGAVESHFSHPLPESLRELYVNPSEIMRSDINVIPPDGSNPIYICFYNPADAENLRSPWPGCEKYFAFADDGAGNQLLVDPRQDDPPVLWHDHETGEFEEVAPSLSAFISWERRKPEE